MRYLIVTLAIAVLAGCAATATGDRPGVFHDRKYNTYQPLRWDAVTGQSRTSLPFHDRKYNTYRPTRAERGERS